MKVLISIVMISMLLMICTTTNAFYMNQPPRYNQRRMQHDSRRRYRQPQQQQQQYYRRPSQRYRREPRQKEIIKDLDHAIELFVPCGRYCNYYDARIIPQQSIGHPRNQQTIHVSGPSGYKKSWDIPRNVDIDGITKSIVHSQYLKLSFPKFYENSNGFEIPEHTNPHVNDNYRNNNNNNNEEVNQNHHHHNNYNNNKNNNGGRRRNKRQEQQKKRNNYIHGNEAYYGNKQSTYNKYNNIYNNENQKQHHRIYENVYDEIKRTKSKSNEHQRKKQEVVDPHFYATSEGIEIIDIDANEIEAELYQKDQKASIGFWNSRGKFQFY